MKNESVSCLTRMKYLIIKWMLSGDCGIVWTFSDPAGQRSHTITAESAKEQEGTSVCWPRYTPFSFYCLWRNDHVFSVGNWFYLYENKQMMLFLKGEMDGLAYTPPVQCSRQQRACVHPSLCLAHRWDERDMSQSNMSLCLRKWDATDEVRINPKGKLVSHPSGKPWHAVAGRRDNSQKLKIVLKSGSSFIVKTFVCQMATVTGLSALHFYSLVHQDWPPHWTNVAFFFECTASPDKINIL